MYIHACAVCRDTKVIICEVPAKIRGKKCHGAALTAPPETFIVNKDGKVLFRFAGPLVGQDFLSRFLPAYEAALSQE